MWALWMASSLLEGGVNGLDIGGGVEAEGDAALIRDDEDAEAGAIEPSDGIGDAGEYFQLDGRGDVAAFGQLAIDDAVAVEEDGAEMTEAMAAAGTQL